MKNEKGVVGMIKRGTKKYVNDIPGNLPLDEIQKIVLNSTADDDDELFFVEWLTDERRLALFPVETIVRYPHHCESPTRSE